MKQKVKELEEEAAKIAAISGAGGAGAGAGAGGAAAAGSEPKADSKSSTPETDAYVAVLACRALRHPSLLGPVRESDLIGSSLMRLASGG